MFKIKSLLLLALSVVASVAFAQEEEKPKLDISGAVDMYYRYDFAKQGGDNYKTSFATENNSFALGMANVIFAQEFGKVGFVADLAYGQRAIDANAGGDPSNTADAFIKQLYVTYSPSESVTLTAGNFGTFVGYELIDANGNFNYTTSYLFSNGPFFHTGIKADFDLGSGLSAMVGVFNQTDGKTNGGMAPKFVGGQLGYAPEDGALALYLNTLYGENEQIGTVGSDDYKPAGANLVFDLTGTYQATEDFLIGLNASMNQFKAFGSEVNTGFAGAAAYLNYSISEKVALGVRGEYFMDYDADDIDATKEVSTDYMEFTLSANITEGPLTIVPEIRIDTASEDVFLDADKAMVGNTTSAVLAAYYSF